jgi:tRNA threonylcarbamoyladenosine biosynthesis protein TsaB
MPTNTAATPPTPALVIDGSGSSVFVGVLSEDGSWLAQSEQTGTPLESLFPCVEAVLASARLSLPELRGFIYCEGPGSVLGLRLCAMAIETWSRLSPDSAHIFAYNSLQLTAALIGIDAPATENALLVSDWKKDAWNAVTIKNGQAGQTDAIDDASMAARNGPLYHLPQRKGWQKPPADAIPVEYSPARLLEVLGRPGLLRATSGVPLYAAGVNTFQKWTPDRHRG